MAIDSKFSEAEIKAISIANHKEIESKRYLWKTRLEKSNEYSEAMNILEDRMAEIRELYENADQDEQATLEQEWIALVIHKDKHLRLKIEEENEHIKNQYVLQLYKTLKVLGTFSFPNERDVILRRNMAKMFHQVGKYCIRNNIETKADGIATTNENESSNSTSMPPPIPPPPPPPPPLEPFCKSKLQHQTPNRKTPQTHRNPITENVKPSKEYQTPLNPLKYELMRSIQQGRTFELKRTPCKRSPGGTPFKRQRRLSENDTSDLITIALRRKFKNVNNFASPNENISPNMRSPSLEFP